MYLWDPTNNGTKPVARLLGHQNKVNHVQFSPDGTLIASAGWDNATKLWNARDGKFLKSLRGHVAPVRIWSLRQMQTDDDRTNEADLPSPTTGIPVCMVCRQQTSCHW